MIDLKHEIHKIDLKESSYYGLLRDGLACECRQAVNSEENYYCNTRCPLATITEDESGLVYWIRCAGINVNYAVDLEEKE